MRNLRPFVTVLCQLGTAGLSLLVKQRRPPFERCDDKKRKHSVVDRVVIKWIIFPFPGLNEIIIFLLIIYFIWNSFILILQHCTLRSGLSKELSSYEMNSPF